MSDTTQIILSSLKRERPVCFRPEEFFDEGFNVDTFLALNRKSFTLESLKKDLEKYSSTIQSSLVELINRDYADFVNLSTNLVGVDQTILKLEAPLTSIQADIEIIRSSIQSEIEQISEKLVLRSEIRNKQEVLYSLLNINKLIIKIENLISQNTEEKENLFERVASEYSQLNFYISKYEELPFVQEMFPRIKKIDQYLEGGLYTAFKSGLESGDKASVAQCLRIFTTLDRIDKSEKLYAESVISPLIDRLINKATLSELGLRGVYQSVLDSLPAATTLVLSLTTPRKDNELRSFEFMGNAVFPVIVSKICTNIPSIFAAGNPRHFQQAYKDTIWFLVEFERLAGYRERVVALRQHSSYKTFLSRWSLPIYFQIRLQEIAGSLEHQLLTPFSPKPSNSPFLLPTSEMLVVCMRRCWEGDVLLKPLTHRFFKLTIQLLKRYAVWLQEIPGSSEELQLSDVCSAVLDTTSLVAMVRELVEGTVSPHLPSYNPELVEESCREILQSIPTLAEHVTCHVTDFCCKAIDQAQAVPRLYRRTNRETPTEPLGYVSGLTECLETEIHNSCLPEPYKAEWCSKVANTVIVRYHSAISEILVSLRKTEDSLAMLKRGRKSAAQQGSTGPANTDEDKIRTQLKLDVTALGTKLEELGIPRGEDFESLLTLVSQTKR